jgi:hypothetical protein
MFTKKTTDNNQQQPQPTTTNNNHNSSNNFIWYVFHWTDKAPSVEDERSSHYWYKNSSLRAWNHPSHVPSNSPLVDLTMPFQRISSYILIFYCKLKALSSWDPPRTGLNDSQCSVDSIYSAFIMTYFPIVALWYLDIWPLNLTQTECRLSRLMSYVVRVREWIISSTFSGFDSGDLVLSLTVKFKYTLRLDLIRLFKNTRYW